MAEVRRSRQPKEENKKLQQMVADFSPDKRMPQDVLSRSCPSSALWREIAIIALGLDRIKVRNSGNEPIHDVSTIAA